MAVTAAPYCPICACQVRAAQVRDCSNEECPLRGTPIVYDSKCSNILRELGHAYPRTCLKCGLGPCKVPGAVMLPYKTKPGDPKMATARMDAGESKFVEEVRGIIDQHMVDVRAQMADLLRQMADEMSPVKDRGDGYETGD